jgi:hypothetical protein
MVLEATASAPNHSRDKSFKREILFMKKQLLLAAAALVSFATPSHAFYTECTVKKDIEAMDRPHGITMGRWSPLKKGEKVAVRDTYQDWVFVLHFPDGGQGEYGWVPRNILDNCKSQEGTP